MSILSDKEIKALCVLPKKKTIYPQDPNRHYDLPGGGRASTLMGWDSTPREVDWTQEELDAYVPMIKPFSEFQIREGQGSITKPMGSVGGIPTMVTIPTGPRWKILSYGLDSHGYDIRLSDDVKVFTNINSTIINPKDFDDKCLHQAKIMQGEHGSRYVIIPPNSYALGVAIEKFNMPGDVSGLVVGKSTYARCSVIVNPTKIQPGYKGDLVLEFSNSSNLPAMLYIDEGVASCSFFRSAEFPEKSYADLKGLYQEQTGVQLPVV